MKRTVGLLLAAVIGGSLTAASCDGEKTATEPSTLELATIVQQSIPGQTGGKVQEVIRDPAAWNATWSKLREGSALPATPPAVDFGQEMVIVAAMETQSCVSKVTIRSAAQVGGELVVDILEAPPAPNCVCITSERPIHVVRTRRVDAPPRFNIERGQTPC